MNASAQLKHPPVQRLPASACIRTRVRGPICTRIHTWAALTGLALYATALSVLASSQWLALSTDQQSEVAHICLPVEFRDGTAAYRECVLTESRLRSEDPASASNAVPAETQAAEAAPSGAVQNPQSPDASAATNGTVEPADASVSARADTATVPSAEDELPAAADLAAPRPQAGAAAANDQDQIESAPAPALAPPPALAGAKAEPPAALTEPLASADSNDAGTATSTDAANPDDSDADAPLSVRASNMAESTLDKVGNWWHSLVAQVQAGGNTARLALAAALIVPGLLLALWGLVSASRGRRRDQSRANTALGTRQRTGSMAFEPALDVPALDSLDRRLQNPMSEDSPTEVVQPPVEALEPLVPDQRRYERDLEAPTGIHIPPRGVAQPNSPVDHPDSPQSAAGNSPARPASTAGPGVTRLVQRVPPPAPSAPDPAATRLVSQPANISHPARKQPGFQQLLDSLDDAQRQQSCIELLIYWMAYGDDRYPPDLPERLAELEDPGLHDRIKLLVLQHDVEAFAIAIGWLRRYAARVQLEQVIDLLMALLITEQTVTPVQNTLLRFLSDQFSLGKRDLERRFDEAFGHPLPPLPEADDGAWWRQQNPDQVDQWDISHLATMPERAQLAVRLGVAPDADEADIIRAFRRASRRCHPDRFSALGDRERTLAQKQFSKFEEARDRLLGVSL